MTLVETFSGIRGIYGKDFTDDIATRYAYAFGEFLRARKNKDIKVVVGRDTRYSGQMLRLSIVDGLRCNVIDCGIAPTPTVENAVREFKADGGVIITASHNEAAYNGLKFLDMKGTVLKPADMNNVIQRFKRLNQLDDEGFFNLLYKENKIEHAIRIDKMEKIVLKKYAKFISCFFNKKDRKLLKSSRLKIIIDPNGGAGIFAKDIFNEFGIKFLFLNDVKGEFKRRIEPNEESLKYLKNIIKRHKAAFAAGFDCDADRVEILLADGTLVSGNHILALIVDDILSGLKHPEEETIIVNDATSYLVREIVRGYNAKWMEVETGEINVVDAMFAFNGHVGGEGSNGGVIIPPSRCRDGVLTLIYLYKILSKKKKNLKELVEDLPNYYYLTERVKLKRDFKEIREKIKKHYLDAGFSIEETGDETGGMKFIKDNSWVWFRQSKTEDKLLRIIADSKDEKVAKDLMNGGKNITVKCR